MNKTKSFAKMLVALLVAMFAFTCFAPVQASAFSNGTQGDQTVADRRLEISMILEQAWQMEN